MPTQIFFTALTSIHVYKEPMSKSGAGQEVKLRKWLPPLRTSQTGQLFTKFVSSRQLTPELELKL